MSIFGKWSIQLNLLIFIILISIWKINSSSYCLQDDMYFDSVKKQCLPCKTCNPPLIVIATCNIYSNTVCGVVKLSGGSFLGVLQESSESLKDFTKEENVKSLPTANHDKVSRHKRKNNTEIIKRSKKFRRKFPLKNIKSNETFMKELHYPLANHTNLAIHSLNQSEIVQEFKNEDDYGTFKDDNLSSETNASLPIKHDSVYRNFFFSYLGKAIVSAFIISLNLLFIIVLTIKIIKACSPNKSKASNCSYSCNQKLPHPSQLPVKCRFTAVLPSKAPDYANVDSYLNSVTSPLSTNSCSLSQNNFCLSTTLPHITQTSGLRGSNPDIRLVRGNVEREPLVNINPEVIERANTIQLYSRIPSPNPFTMDKLLEHRRAVGSSSTENNLYVETWCSSPSPMLSRSQGSSIAPSPALSCVRKPLNISNSSSPLTTRTFRATPAFTSFQFSRS